MQENPIRTANLTRLFVGHDSMATQGDEPEQQDANHEVRTDILLAPSVICCRADAAHMPVSNANRLPYRAEQPKTLDAEHTRSDGSQTRSDQSNRPIVRCEAAREPTTRHTRAQRIERQEQQTHCEVKRGIALPAGDANLFRRDIVVGFNRAEHP